ncbi:MAG: TonB-dependent receptor [Rubrivivax sp.]|nr:TonB-dependent receptor [Rubrivivax sp.]
MRSPAHPARRPGRTRHPHALRATALGAMTLAAVGAQAQNAAPAPAPQRVEVTGTSIKRLAGETALPVQTIRREDIDKSGVTTAAELLRNISASAAQLADGASITDNTGGQRGFNGANLRGLGVSSTLVLLNGRRMANFASPGDAAGVDLNSIPAGAIQRVEVLKDGASAIYGTDAIGGVINFITRQDYQGADLGLLAAATQEGGAGKRTGTISGGIGSLANDRYNVFAVLDVQQLDALRSTQRKFIQERPLKDTVPYYLSSRPYPANLRLASGATGTAERAALTAAGYTINGSPYTQRLVNLFAPGCNPPASVFASSIGSEACGYDYMADTEIYPDSNKVSLLTRGAWQLSESTQLFAELVKARAKTRYVLSPNPTTVTGVRFPAINAYLPRPVADVGAFDIRVRATEAGNRSNEVTSDADRVVAGVTGQLSATWEYSAALSWAANEVADRYVNGYFRFNEFATALKAGQINPFGASPATGKALIDSLRIDDVARRSKGTTEGIDVKLTGSLGKLDGGDLGAAFGVELRRETQKFTPSALLVGNNIAGDRDSSGTSPPPAATSNARRIASAYAEFSAPFTKTLEAQFALRFDHYERVGSAVNPKLGLRWQPSKTFLVRGSAGTGFRAPSFSELYRPTVYGTSPAFLYDGVYDSFEQFPTVKQANPDLKPEKSRQFSLGAVFEPAEGFSVAVDFWSIRKTDVISDLYEKTILENPTRYAAYITRDPADDFPTILLKKENQGGLKTAGLDIDIAWKGATTAIGRFGATLNGSRVLKYERQFGKLEPFVSNLGRFLNDQVIQRWRHRIGFDWDSGPYAVSLGNTYYASYTDDSYLPDTAPRRVSAYSLWDVSASWKVTSQLQLRAGLQNLLNKQPPYSNQSYYFLSTYDPTYTDPRGRTLALSLKYRF